MRHTLRIALVVALVVGGLVLVGMALPREAGAWRSGSHSLYGGSHFSSVHTTAMSVPLRHRGHGGALAERAGFGLQLSYGSRGRHGGRGGFRLHAGHRGHGRRHYGHKRHGSGHRFRRHTIYNYRGSAYRPYGSTIYRYGGRRYKNYGYKGYSYRPDHYGYGRKDYDESNEVLDRRLAQVLEVNRDGESSSWVNTDTESETTVTPTRSYRGRQYRGRQYCRQYTVAIVEGGRKRIDYRRACRKSNGVWEVAQ
jgi:hypothetical protein